MGSMEPQTFHSFEQSGWQRAADHYGDAFGGLTSQTIPRLSIAAHVGAGTRLLDVASGPGYVAAAGAALGATAVGVDFSSAMVGLAAGRYPGIRFEEGDAEALPFADDRFDAVTLNFGVLHLARPDTALTEARRVLVPGGRCALTVWAKPEQSVGFGIVLRAIEAHGRMDVPLPEGPPFFRFADPDEATRSLIAAGFVEPSVEAGAAGLAPGFGGRPVRRVRRRRRSHGGAAQRADARRDGRHPPGDRGEGVDRIAADTHSSCR